MRLWLVCACLVAAVLPSVCSWSRPRRGSNLRDVSSHLDDYRLPKDVEPAGYTLSLVLHMEDGWFRGEEWVNITCRHRTSTIVMHAHEDLSVSGVSVSVNPLASTVVPREIGVKHVDRDLDKQLLIIMLSENLEGDNTYRIHLRFNGSLDNSHKEGLYRRKFVDSTNNRTHWYLDTNMKLDSARRIFPCFDEPEYKAVFDVKVATPRRQHVISNMPLADITEMRERSGWYWKHFKKSPPLATMSFGMFLFEFEYYSQMKGVFRVSGLSAKRNDIEKALEHLEQVYEFFLEYLGIENPVPQLDLVVLPDNIRKELAGSFGIIVLDEESVDRIESIAYLTIGQWVEHLMTPQWWGELDVSSGIILHLGHTFLEKRNYRDTWDMNAEYYEYSKIVPCKNLGSQRDCGDLERASWFVRMIQYTLTEETFITAFRKFLQMKKYGTFNNHDLWTFLTQHGWDEHTLPKDVLIEDMAKSWLTKERFPVVTVTRNYGRNTATAQQKVFLKRKFYRVPDVEQMLWYIPIMYLSPDNLNVSAVRPVAWMKNQREITIKDLPEADQFIIVNPAEIGMFMVNYDTTNWAMLADALHRKILPTAVRVKLLHDSWNLAFSGELNYNSAMNMTLYLKDETEYAVWNVVHTMYDHVGRFLDGTSAGDKFKRYYVQQATRAMEKMGDQSRSHGEGRNVYNLLKYSTMTSTTKKPTQDQQVLFEAWASGNGDSSPKTVEAMCLIFEYGTMEEFERGLRRFIEVSKQPRQDSRSPGLLKLITNCAKQPEKIERLLTEVFLGQNTGFTDRDKLNVESQLTGYYDGYNTMFSFLRENWEALRQALEDKPDVWLNLVEDSMTLFKTEAGLKAAAQFFADKRSEMGNAAPSVQAGLEEMTANVQWSKENVPVLERWLDQHLSPEDPSQKD